MKNDIAFLPEITIETLFFGDDSFSDDIIKKNI